MGSRRPIRKLLVANRSEIAIRVLRAANELGIRTVAIFSHEDRYALHRSRLTRPYLVGSGRQPIDAYTRHPGHRAHRARSAGRRGAPGYGFLSENPEFAEACIAAGLVFVGPSPEVMRSLGSKLEARRLAGESGLATVPATDALPTTRRRCAAPPRASDSR